jgi:hypothetical protein
MENVSGVGSTLDGGGIFQYENQSVERILG